MSIETFHDTDVAPPFSERNLVMHLQLRRFAFTFAGLLASVSLASAQGPWSTNPLAPAAIGSGCSGCAATAAAAPSHAAASEWCGDKASGHRFNLASKLFSPFTIGQGCASPVGCSTFASERTFLFGSCNQFFNAGTKCGHGLCIGSTFGSGGLGDHQRCVYGSNLNR